jgi:hypothetical protein
LAKLLVEHYGTSARAKRPRLKVPQILAWADAHFARTGTWPSVNSGRIVESLGETWRTINSALDGGFRGLPGGTSLARMLREHFGASRGRDESLLTEAKILAWADAYHAEHGVWPTKRSGPIAKKTGCTWRGIDVALRKGLRGLPIRSSLAKLLVSSGRKRSRRGLWVRTAIG